MHVLPNQLIDAPYAAGAHKLALLPLITDLSLMNFARYLARKSELLPKNFTRKVLYSNLRSVPVLGGNLKH